MAIFDIRDYMNSVVTNASEAKLVEDMYEEEIDITSPEHLEDEGEGAEGWDSDKDEYSTEVEFGQENVEEELEGQAEHDYGYEEKRPKRYNIDAYDYKGRAEAGRTSLRRTNNYGDNPMKTEDDEDYPGDECEYCDDENISDLGDDDYDLDRLRHLSGMEFEESYMDLHDSDENAEESLTENKNHKPDCGCPFCNKDGDDSEDTKESEESEDTKDSDEALEESLMAEYKSSI